MRRSSTIELIDQQQIGPELAGQRDGLAFAEAQASECGIHGADRLHVDP
ncbi:MAG: hypothetical protein ACRD2Z_16085 [Thermoanaerobaculia bacterium]